MNLPDFKHMYRDMAKNAGLSGHLECETCKRTQPLSEEQAAGYLAKGWPKCCGKTMRTITAGPPEKKP